MSDAAYIYAIQNIHNGNMYIGSTVNYKSRWHTHRSALNNNRHHSFILQKAWNKYGKDAFVFKLMLICSPKTRYFYEQTLMKLQKYNVYRTVNECKVRGGWKHSEAFKEKMSLLNKGKSLTEEHRKKLSIASMGRKYDDSFKRKASARQTGVSPSEVTRKRLSDSLKAYNNEATDERSALVKEIYESYRYGDNLTHMVKDKGISTTTFYMYCKELGLQSVKKKAIALLVTQIQKLTSEGLSFKTACEQLNVNYRVVKKLYDNRMKQ